MKIRPVEAEFYAGGRRDRHDEANSRFSQFCERASKRLEKSQKKCVNEIQLAETIVISMSV